MSSLSPSPDDDRLSNLHVALKQTILDLMPIRDAARTCTLSKAWRETWTMRPCLVLNKLFYLQVISNKNEEAEQLSAFSSALDKIFAVQTGPIVETEIYIPPKLEIHHIHHWVQHLTEKDVEVFRLDNSENDACLLPSVFFDFAKLKVLELDKWILSPPPESRCFSNIVSVDLLRVSISAPVSFGSQLQDLELRVCNGIEHLVFANINNLKTLIIGMSSKIDWRWLENAKNLERFGIVLTHADFIQSKSVNFIKLLSNCTRINLLLLHDFLLEILGPDPFTLKTHATRMVNLKTLDLRVLSFNLLRISNFLCLIRNLPNLENLIVTLDFKVTRSNSVDSAIERHLEALDWEDVVLDKLQIVQILGVIGVRSELQFLKILLTSSPSLQEISVFCSTAISNPNEKLRIKQEFLQLLKKIPARTTFLA
nr:PREDICTED: F-box/FBD/LRR-repeat protein At1g13570-like [Daucus carota subsp. sativus]